MPLGHLSDTLLTLVVGSPQVHWKLHYTVDGQSFTFDDQPVKETLLDIPLSHPTVLAYLRETIETGIRNLHGTA
jgi:hypothetical protein